jgi:DNA ligase (NAD+)
MPTTMREADIHSLVKRLEEANYAYHNGLSNTMGDDQYDALVDQLRDVAPEHPFLFKVGAPISVGDEVTLPIPLPSLNKIKPDGSLQKWAAKFGDVKEYSVSAKLDGCSALWLPATKKLYTRGDGVKGRDISAFVPYFKGLVCPPGPIGSHEIKAVRGELIMRTDSTLIPMGKLARNIVAGALNRQEVDRTFFGEIRFVAYELIDPYTLTPSDAGKLLKQVGFETARATIVPITEFTETHLSELFSSGEAVSPYQMDGIVVAPNVARTAPATDLRNGQSVNPADRVAWKTRLTAATRRTTVRSVEWNISHQRNMIPRVLFDPVELQGATISAATGLHGRWIFTNGVGPGAEIEIRRAGDTIPQIIAVHKVAPAGPFMPSSYQWENDSPTAIHIQPVEGEGEEETALIRLTHALQELGAENVGPGLVAKMYEAGFTTLKAMYDATATEFAEKVDGCKQKMAERIWIGLRVKQADWTELNLMCASCTMPRGVSHTKLQPLLSLEPNPAKWTTALFQGRRPAGLSDKTVEAIVTAIPAYLTWRSFNFPGWKMPSAEPMQPQPTIPASGKVIVFTGFRDKDLEAHLQAAGHEIAATVTKKTTHVVHADGIPTSTKITKAREAGVAVMSVSEFRKAFGFM